MKSCKSTIIGLLMIISCFAVLVGRTEDAAGLTNSEKNTIRVFQQVSPGVVNITTTSIGRDFFLNPVPSEGSGSGVVVNKSGHIVTSYHVVQGSNHLEVTLADGSRWQASLVGSSPKNDLALIKIEAPPAGLLPLSIGSSENLRVGQKVLALGNPFGLGQTLTTGSISSLGRNVRIGRDVVIEHVIQADAAINPGNSGGPLINADGEVIGINTAIFSPTGSSVGISFAIPADTVRSILPGMVSPWPKIVSWILAVILVVIFLRWFWRRLQTKVY